MVNLIAVPRGSTKDQAGYEEEEFPLHLICEPPPPCGRDYILDIIEEIKKPRHS